MFAGITVCIALLGMFALGVSFLYGVAIAASIAVLFTVVSALTLLRRCSASSAPAFSVAKHAAGSPTGS